MIYTHITLSEEIDSQVRDYCSSHNLKYSQAIRNLVELGLNSFEANNQIVLNNTLLSKILSKSIYTIELIEKMYSDLEITNNSNPKNNKVLQDFKSKRYKDTFDD